MPAYNFQKQFVPLIIGGQKPHTIRKRRKRPTKPGDSLMLYTGLRTKSAFMFAYSVCSKVEPIIIYPFIGHIRKSDGVLMEEQEIEALAKADGFQDAESFFNFFCKTYEKSELNDFEIIYWDMEKLEAWLPPMEVRDAS